MAVDQQIELTELMGILALRLRANGVEPAGHLGLSTLDLALLARVAFDGPTNPKNLSVDLSVPPATLTTALDRLEARALIGRRRNPNDRRSVLIEKTKNAFPALQRSIGDFASACTEMVASLSDLERNSLTDLLQRGIESLVGEQAIRSWAGNEVG